ncbi:unnamed protein product [Pedinophyceae sp. YPF-701]|nr:unnamed protein product [Pedinophyceae sp. YPF-701]
MASEEENAAVDPIVIDIGSGTVKAGISGYEQHQLIMRTLVAREAGAPKLLVGGDLNKAEASSDVHVKPPVDAGEIVNFEDVEEIIKYCIKMLKCEPEETPVLVLESPTCSKAERAALARILLEKLGVPKILTSSSGKLALFGAGAMTGVVVSVGHGVTHVTPVLDGNVVVDAVQRLPLGGRDITLQIQEAHGGDEMPFHVANRVKEHVAYVADDFEEESGKEFEERALLNLEHEEDGIIKYGPECFRAPEILFDPSLAGLDARGVHELVFEAIRKCPAERRAELYSAILLTGGTTLLKNFPERLQMEVRNLAPEGSAEDVAVVAPDDRQHSAWVGGSVLCGLGSVASAWLTKEEYDADGEAAVEQKLPF